MNQTFGKPFGFTGLRKTFKFSGKAGYILRDYPGNFLPMRSQIRFFASKKPPKPLRRVKRSGIAVMQAFHREGDP